MNIDYEELSNYIPEEILAYMQMQDDWDDYEGDTPLLAQGGPEIEPGQPSAPLPSTSPSNKNSKIEDDWDKDDPKTLEVYFDEQWHGWELRGYGAIHVGYLPHRKRPCLYIHKDGIVESLASFRDEETAKKMLYWLDVLVQVFAKVKYDSD